MLLGDTDLATLVWSETVSRQAQTERIARWLADQYIQPVASRYGACFQLGRIGARLLREAGFTQIAPVRPFAERVRSGLLLTNRFGVSLWNDLHHDVGITGSAWAIRPFTGAAARGDGLCAMQYTLGTALDQSSTSCVRMPELLEQTYTPPRGAAVQRFVIELDSGTEDTKQLVRRAAHWRKLWEQTTWPAATHCVFLWITTGGSARLDAIWRTWTQHALLPAFFTTVETLTFGSERFWYPWNPRRVLPNATTVWVWRDMYGRPRSLRPWDLQEPHLRFEQPQPILFHSLSEAIAQSSR